MKVNFEVVSIDNQKQLAPLVWQTLIEQKIVGDETNDFKDESLDSLLNRRSAIDGIIERGST